MNYLENLSIYFGNLSCFYIFSLITSVAIVVLTIYMGIATRLTTVTTDNMEARGGSSKEKLIVTSSSADESEDSDTNDMRIESVRQLKTAKLKSLENTLTEEQKEVEKQIEKVQLAAIYDLLKKQNEEFCMNSNLNEDELQEQLSLYR
ncbi:uncharacterized protein LOC129720704 [Wyeomyia smithii]|uniref:uncharacterized protein LOC129720704 n=1 Tax=Wyeomyia smithii TaxID=174621 RepID=UPI002467E3E2|nr:uncharacterized protein LOC129720704 [Wyeomyia smithii]